MQETAPARTHKRPQTWSSGPVYVRNTRKSMGHQLEDKPLRINTKSGLAFNPGVKLKNSTHTLQDAPWHDT
jgi:hypothetical protein